MDSVLDMLAGLPEPDKRQFNAYVQHTLNTIRHKQLQEKAITRNQIEQKVEVSDANSK